MENKKTAPVVNMSRTTDEIWRDICNKVVADAFTQVHILETIEYMKSKYKVENKQHGNPKTP